MPHKFNKRSTRMRFEGTAFLLQSLRAQQSGADTPADPSDAAASGSVDSDDSEESSKAAEPVVASVSSVELSSSVSADVSSCTPPISSFSPAPDADSAADGVAVTTTVVRIGTPSLFDESMDVGQPEPAVPAQEEPVLAPKEAEPVFVLDVSAPPELLWRGAAATDSLLNNYFKGCKWSPDGALLLTNSEDRVLRVLHVGPRIGADSPPPQLSSVRHGDLVYDYCWLPTAEWASPSYATTSRDHPIHLWAASDGANLATYRPINHLDEMSCAHCLAFSLDGERLFAGFNKMIRVFDTRRAGRQIDDRPTSSKVLVGQSGIISCIAMLPNAPGTYAAASYGRTVAVYSERSQYAECVFSAHNGGITHIQFSRDGIYLFTGGRKDSEICCWDMRYPGQMLCSFRREVDTNQRIYFDIDSQSNYLVCGTTNGLVRFYDLGRMTKVIDLSNSSLPHDLEFVGHHSAVNGISLNPRRRLLASASGQRVFPRPLASDSDGDSGDSDASSCEDYERGAATPSRLDNSLCIWQLTSAQAY